MIPRNWRWSTLENVSDVIMGQSPNGEETTSDSTYIPLIGGAADMGNLFPIITRYTKVPTKLSQKDDVIICVRATLGRPIYSDGVYCLGRGVAAIRSNILIKEYIRYFLINNEQYLYENATGSTFLQITSIKLKSMPIPVPPLDEQQRIVDIIENLFSKLDRAKALAQNVVDNYELRRSAILNTVFNGSDNLEIKSLDECGTWSGGGTPSMKHKEYWENANILWVTPKDMKSDTINNTQMKINSIGVENSSAKLIKNPSVLFVMRSGILRHTLPISMIELEFTCNQDLKVLTPFDKINVKYLMLACKANEKSILNNCMKNGTTVESINFDALKKFKIKITAIEEQKEIVRILDSLLAKEQQTKELAEQILQKIDLMKKSILARAFRGEFESNNLNN